MSPEDRATLKLALGRIFRLMSREAQPGDIEEYERCRAIAMDILDPPPYQEPVCWARDRLKGAQGDQ